MAEPLTRSVVDLEDSHFSGATPRRPVTIVRARGARLWDDGGKEYIDCAAAQGWANVGHSHPEVTRAVRDQADVLVAHTESSYNDVRARWFSELCNALERSYPAHGANGLLDRVQPCSSGTEANETALKVARAFTGREEIVALEHGFHGRTFGSLSATWNPKYRDPFAPLVPGFRHVSVGDERALDEAITDRVAAVIVEVLQGEGGVRPVEKGFLGRVESLCRERGALLIVDEVQTGLGRTGTWFAGEHAGLNPDVITLGKSLGGGLPMGATVWREGLGTLSPGSHGTTFGGNPLCCAASRAVLRVLENEGLVERANRLGAGAKKQLEAAGARMIKEVRGRGLMIGVELRKKVTPVLKELLAEGVWALPAGPMVLRLLPPLMIPEEDWARAIEAVKKVLGPSRA